MADLATVENFLMNAVAATMFSQPYTAYSVVTSDIGSTTGNQFRAMRGWPIDNQLNLDLTAGIVSLNVFSMPGARDTTRFLRQMTTVCTDAPQATMLATLVGNVVTFSGVGDPRELVAIAYFNAGFSVRLTAGMTPDDLALAFAAGLPNATASGPSVTVNTHQSLRVDIGMDQRIDTEVHRQMGYWKVGIWSPTTEQRDIFGGQIDSGVQFNDRFFFPDGSCSGPIINAGGMVDDRPQKAKCWRRDLHYCIEYPTEYVQVVPVMVLGKIERGDRTYYI